MKRYVISLVVALCLGFSARADIVQGYSFSTGVDASKWIELSTYTTLDGLCSPLVDMGFDFYFFGENYRYFSVTDQGVVRFETTYSTRHNSVPLAFMSAVNMAAIKPPFIMPFGSTMDNNRIHRYVHYAVLESGGYHVVVCDFGLATTASQNDYPDFKFQVQLNERDGSVTIVYGSSSSGVEPPIAQLGMGVDIDNDIIIDPTNHTISTGVSTVTYNTWPGTHRFYRFVPAVQPPCPKPVRLNLSRVTTNSADVSWARSESVICYRVSYGLAGGMMTTVTTTDTIFTVTGLRPDVQYEVSVAAMCGSGVWSLNRTIHFRTACNVQEHNQFDFSNLDAPGVECRIGTFYDPSQNRGKVDYGPESNRSRHTIHRDVSEVDPRTDGLLRTVPDGCCASVRLGNWQSGAEEEDITYTIVVDTQDYDLLILHYAIVEENPNHEQSLQPRFEIKITDESGDLVSACEQVTFIAGFDNVWNVANNSVVWHDWDVIGLDLAPLHGQTIKVTVANYDCAAEGHYGYGYYYLESATKRLTASTCGDSLPTTLSAPYGFRYNWYRAADTNTLLSVERTLTVNVADAYLCRLNYGSADLNCNFTLTTTSGPRYPVAAFTSEPQDGCGMRQRMLNQSVISSDVGHTHLTNLPCEQYLWRFDDGTTSTQENPIHTFTIGDHPVELVAMLANGQCRDSVRQVIHVAAISDTLYDTICYGGRYLFYGNWLLDSGTYQINDGCYHHELHLHAYYESLENEYDTICSGDTLMWHDNPYWETGAYIQTYSASNGCDSAVVLNLQVNRIPILESEMYQTCDSNAYYYLDIPESLECSWTTDPPDAPQPYLDTNHHLRFSPDAPTTYYLYYQEIGGLSCVAGDTIRLTPAEPIKAHIRVSPSALTCDNLKLQASDNSYNATGRQWYVDSVLLMDNSPVFYYEASPDRDSIRLTLEAYNNSCRDTVDAVVPILCHTMLFPNVFTPGLTDNNSFGPIARQVSDYELWVYDRRGNLVFHSKDLGETWDGTCRGVPCKQEAYVYVCHYRIPEGDQKSLTGTVTLIR